MTTEQKAARRRKAATVGTPADEIERAAQEYANPTPKPIGFTTFDLDQPGEFWAALAYFMEEPELQHLVFEVHPGAADPDYELRARWRMRLVGAFAGLLGASYEHQRRGESTPDDYELANIVGSALNPDEQRHAAAMRAFEDWHEREAVRKLEVARENAPGWIKMRAEREARIRG